MIRIVEQASSISERLAGQLVVDETRPNHALVTARLEKWCQTVADGDWAEFRRRLACDGLTLDTAQRLLGPVRLADDRPLPWWAQTLAEVFVVALEEPCFPGGDAFPASVDRCLDPDDPVPFEEVLLPFVQVARRRLADQAGTGERLLSNSAHAALECHLLRDLSRIGARTLLSAFSVFQVLEQRAKAPPPVRACTGVSPSPHPPLAERGTEPPAREHYVAFVKRLLDGGLPSFFHEYSVLGRLLATKTDFWVEATAEFLRRLQADWPEVQSVFQPHAEQVSSVRPGLSDPHSHGRTVIAVEFASGLRLVYKPKDVGIERAYQNLVRWLNAQGLTPALKPLTVIDRGTHGWVEFVEPRPCQNEEEARLFYRRAGLLLALFYVLQGMDYHHENLIACGPHPMPVDHEMLLYPYLREGLDGSAEGSVDPDTAQVEAHRLLNRSALSSGLLPVWETNADGQVYDIGALGGIQEQKQAVRQLQWQNTNTDSMARVWQSIPVEAGRAINRPTLNGAALVLSDYEADLVAGFRQMYRFLLEQREALLAPDGPLAGFAGQAIRFTFRKTRLYWSLLEATLAPRFMRDGADRSIQLDALSRALLSEDQPSLWPLVRSEQAALAQMDIPRFTGHTDGHALKVSGDERIDDAFSESGYALARARLAGLSEGDLERQIGFIRVAIGSWEISREEIRGEGGKGKREKGEKDKGDEGRQGTGEKGEGKEAERETRADFDSVVALAPGQMVEEAIRIAERLRAGAIRPVEGATWIHLAWNPRIRRFQLEPLGDDLYSGSCGVALFLAALSSVTGEASHGDLALAALQPLRESLSHDPRVSDALMGIGGATGLGSVIYALVHAGQFLGEGTLLEAAHQAAALITPGRIAEDRALDIISGAAGAILGLLALHRLTASPPGPLFSRVGCSSMVAGFGGAPPSPQPSPSKGEGARRLKGDAPGPSEDGGTVNLPLSYLLPTSW
ncbi:MAG TPA: hypothetical protein DEP84_10230, partial [Chloroflexi bacterium]|nr:hypothetical protein [Chloroflexota bacterium]